jgi:dephospho-CoA kinase
MASPHIIFLSGASGAGKTTLIRALSRELIAGNKISILHFDSVGVPSEEEMIKQYGSGSNWQKAMTFYWIKHIVQNLPDKNVVFIEGQVNFLFIFEALKHHHVESYTLVLIHADPVERHQRLRHNRQQEHLINNDMDNWANYLMNQAKNMNALIIDTSITPIENCLNILKALI